MLLHLHFRHNWTNDKFTIEINSNKTLFELKILASQNLLYEGHRAPHLIEPMNGRICNDAQSIEYLYTLKNNDTFTLDELGFKDNEIMSIFIKGGGEQICHHKGWCQQFNTTNSFPF